MYELLLIVAEQTFMHFPLILGAYISVSLMKVPDLSLESAYVFGAIFASTFLPFLTPIPLLLLIPLILSLSFAAGMLVGTLSGFLTQIYKIPHLLSSIITIGIFHGISQMITGPYVSLNTSLNPLYSTILSLHPELPTLFVIFILCSLSIHYLFSTQLGYCIAVLGDNPSFFKHYGISTCYIYMIGIIIANGLAGLSGYLSAQSNGFADISMGFGKVLLCITALIIGKNIQQKTLSIIPATVGLFGYFFIQQLLLKVGFDLRYFSMIQALLILIIMLTVYTKKHEFSHNQLGV